MQRNKEKAKRRRQNKKSKHEEAQLNVLQDRFRQIETEEKRFKEERGILDAEIE